MSGISAGDVRREESRFCNSCGRHIETDAQFCGACGRRVQPSDASTSAPAGIPKTAEAARARLVAAPERVVFRWILGSSLALGLGSIGPWATASVFGITVSASGLHGGGWVTLLVAGASVALLLDPTWLGRVAWLRRRRLGAMVGLAGLAFLICLLNLIGVEDSGLEGVVHPGWGLYLSTIASIGLAVWAWAARTQRRGALLSND